jgi:hypothetical protein
VLDRWSIRTHLHRSVGLVTVPAAVALLALHLALRGHAWSREWYWATYDLGFSTVYLGPLCAGLGTWQGAELSRARPMLDAAGARARPAASAWAALLAWIGGAYLVVAGAVLVALKVSGTLDLPTPSDLSPIVVALALLGAWSAVGLAVGLRTARPALAPAVAAAAFGLTLVAYLVAPLVVKVGGATSSLAFLRPRPAVSVAQCLLYLSVTLASLAGRPGSVRSPQALAGVVGLVGVAVAGSYLVLVPGLEFLDRHPAMTCTEAAPQVCVAAPYRDRVDRLGPYLTPYLRALREVGIDAPRRFTQSSWRRAGEGSVPDEVLRGHPPARGPMGSLGPGGAAVLDGLMAPDCDVTASRRRMVAFDALSAWLGSVEGGPIDPQDPMLPSAVRSPDPRVRSRWLRGAVADLRGCR